ncbi:hypothetical protein MKW92_024823 [Papaver armeniacum]|nr:hypothetical protein MKW92_024823 [Papaver armeniacum]
MKICDLYKSPDLQRQITLNHRIFSLLNFSPAVIPGFHIMATTVLPTSVSAVQTPGILTLKDFQQKNGIGPWMTRVRIVRMWRESDFMRTNDVTTLDLLLLDDTVSSKVNMIPDHFLRYELYTIYYNMNNTP